SEGSGLRRTERGDQRQAGGGGFRAPRRAEQRARGDQGWATVLVRADLPRACSDGGYQYGRRRVRPVCCGTATRTRCARRGRRREQRGGPGRAAVTPGGRTHPDALTCAECEPDPPGPAWTQSPRCYSREPDQRPMRNSPYPSSKTRKTTKPSTRKCQMLAKTIHSTTRAATGATRIKIMRAMSLEYAAQQC